MNVGKLLKLALEAASGKRGALIQLALAIGAIIVSALLGALVYRAFFEGSVHRAQQTVQEIGRQAQAQADNAITTEVINYYEQSRSIDEQVRKGIDNVEAVNSQATMDPELVAAGVDALCMHDDFAAVNRCPMLAPGEAEEANGVSPALHP